MAGWTPVNDRIRVLTDRQYLLVSNTVPKSEGYAYCTKCGRIESAHEHDPKLNGVHRKPYPDDDDKMNCDSIDPMRHIVLGSDFVTDIALFSLRVTTPVALKPGHSSTIIALRTVSEALANAACQLLEIEGSELMAEFRPALTQNGKRGLEAEIFLYDTLPGGAGFSQQLADFGEGLFKHALRLMVECPEGCDESCYRCLRSYKNKFEHALLDRHVGAELLEYLVTGQQPKFNVERLHGSTTLLYNDLPRQELDGIEFKLNALVGNERENLRAPILARTATGQEFVIALSRPLTANYPADPAIARYRDRSGKVPVIVVNELIVRNNLPTATNIVRQQIGVSSQ